MKNRQIVVLTGEIGSGKTTLAEELKRKYDFIILKTNKAIQELSTSSFRMTRNEDNRMFLQRVGETLDKKTEGKWVVDHFQSIINTSSKIIIDSIRNPKQIEALRRSYGHQNVIQIFLKVSPRELERRHFKRNNIEDFNDLQAQQQYKSYKSNQTEKQVKMLIDDADLVLDMENAQISDNIVRVASFLRLLTPVHLGIVDVLVGGQFGSEGKGQVAAHIAPEYDCLVRIGGPNAGHKVFEDDSPETFHILPSGTNRAQHAKIVLGPGTVINADILLNAIRKFEIEPNRIVIDRNCTIITDTDIQVEKDLDKIGSTKQGVGAATANNLLNNRLQLNTKHKAKYNDKLKRFIGSAHEEYEKLFSNGGKILLEGTQGTFLSLHHGIYPYVTSRDTIASGCLSDAGISPSRVRKIIMVTRTYPIRVQSPKGGSSGPFTRNGEDYEISYEELAASSGIALDEILNTEKTSTTKKQRRISRFNWAMFREACELNSPTDIALTFSDYINVKNRKARRYDQLSGATTKFIDEVERCAGVPVSLISTNFNHRSIIDRRNWK